MDGALRPVRAPRTIFLPPRTILLLFLLANLPKVVSQRALYASCPRLCSGHGNCGADAVCTCDSGYTGNDCSLRTCPEHISWVDRPRGDLNHDGKLESSSRISGNTEAFPAEEHPDDVPLYAGEAHFIRECSGIGHCDRSTGLCQCPLGFTGHACNRARCPNDCSGNGVCRELRDAVEDGLLYKSEDRNGAGDLSATGVPDDLFELGEYNLWDGEMMTVCVCDVGFGGIDCSRRLCARGRDSSADAERFCGAGGCVDEIQSLTFQPAEATQFLLQVEYPVGHVRSSVVEVATDGLSGYTPDENAGLVQAALRRSDHDGSLEDIQVSGSGTLGSTQTLTITFTGTGANLPQLTATVLSGPGGLTLDPATVQDGTATDAECSRRGLCDYDTGICACFQGWTGSACRHRTRR